MHTYQHVYSTDPIHTSCLSTTAAFEQCLLKQPGVLARFLGHRPPSCRTYTIRDTPENPLPDTLTRCYVVCP